MQGQSAAERISAAFERGRRRRMEREQLAQQQEDRKLERDILQQRVRQLKIDEQIQARTLAIQGNQLKQGQPGQTKTQAADLGQGIGPGGIPELLQSIIGQKREVPLAEIPGQETPLDFVQGVQTPAKLVETEQPPAPDIIPPVEALGVPGMTLQAQTQKEFQAQSMKALLDKMNLEFLQKQAESRIETPGERTAAKNLAATDARTASSQTFQAGQNALNRESSDRRAAAQNATTIRAAEMRAQITEATKGLPNPIATKIEDVGVGLKTLQDIEAAMPILANLIGPVQGRWTTARQFLGKTTDEEEAALSTLQSYFNVLAKLRSGGAVTPQEEARLKRELQDRNLTPEQFSGRLKTQLGLVRTKLRLIIGGLPAAQKAKAKEALAAIGISDSDAPTGSITVTAPNGQTYTFPDQEKADAFKKAAGIK